MLASGFPRQPLARARSHVVAAVSAAVAQCQLMNGRVVGLAWSGNSSNSRRRASRDVTDFRSRTNFFREMTAGAVLSQRPFVSDEVRFDVVVSS